MFKKTLFVILALISVSIISAQDNETILTIGNTKVAKGEFERIYRKSNSNLQTKSDKKTPAEYMQMFIDFKLKVIEAEELKMDTFQNFINELKGYRSELAVPYLTDVQFSQQQLKDTYERMTKEIHASHILFRLTGSETPAQADSVFAKALKVKKEIESGKSFHEAARDYSEDPSAKSNGGDLGYFSAFQMVTPFEDAVYNAPAGKVGGPVKTAFGLHLIMVHDIRPNQGEIKVAHIMKMFPRDGRQFDKTIYKKQIDSIYVLLKKGADFGDLAKKLSDDKQSAPEGGELPWMSAGNVIADFAGPAFRLVNKGDYSEPVETPFGYHIIKKLDQKPVKPFEELKPEIEEMIKRDPARSVSSKKSFVEKLKKEYGFEKNNVSFKALRNINISTPFIEPLPVLFTLDKKEFTRKDFNNFLATKGIIEGEYEPYTDEWIEYEITTLEDSKLETKYPEFGYIVKEYHDGILLFNISQQKIWDFASKDTIGLENYYAKNKGKYRWNERFKGLVISCKDSLVRRDADKYFAAAIPVNEIKSLINKEGEARIIIEEGAWEKGANQIVDYYVWNSPMTGKFDERLNYIRGDKIKPSKKTLDEARGFYISDYQNFLEKKWIKELRGKHKIKINKKLLSEIKSIE